MDPVADPISFQPGRSPATSFLSRRWAELKMVVDGYFGDRVPRMAAALSYYTIFSLAPLLVIAVAFARFAFDEDSARGHVADQFRAVVGEQGAVAIQTMIENTHRDEGNLLATVIGLVTLLIGATGVFGELQDSLNSIWKVQARPGRTLRLMLRSRLLSFAMVFGSGFLLLVSLVLSAALTAAGAWLQALSGGWWHASMALDLILSFIVIGLLCGASFKLLPDASMRWRDVWLGALLTSVLFTAGKSLIGLYLGKSAIASTYGSMGALAVLLIWVYFSSQAFLIGALFTRAHAVLAGSVSTPLRDAEWIPGHDAGTVIREASKRLEA